VSPITRSLQPAGHGFDARRRAAIDGETVATALSTSPHGLLMRTQNCVGLVIAGV
jgi:hypothetical protein